VLFNHYFFFDGSALIAEIRALQESQGQFKGRRLRPLPLVNIFRGSGPLSQLIGQSYRRAVFYFANNDPQVDKYIVIPDMRESGLVQDISFKWCGERLEVPAGYDEWYAKQEPKFQQFCYKREKGVDVEICCDALQLAALRNLDRLVLLTNDSDFVPLCQKLKAFGSNVSLIHLSSSRSVNEALVKACDSYQVFPESHLDQVFL